MPEAPIDDNDATLIPIILIADDSISNRLSIAAAIADIDADLVMAASGLDTLRLAASDQPALIIVDVDMPDMDGYQVINQLAGNARTTNIPVILLETSFARHKASLHGNSVWPPEILYKPLNYDLLNTRIRVLLQLARFRIEASTIEEFENEMDDKSIEGVMGIDQYGRVRYCNPPLLRMLHTRYPELLGIGMESLIEQDSHDTDPQWKKGKIAVALANDKTVQIKKLTLWTNDDCNLTTTCIAMPIPDHDVLTGLLIFKNISTRSRTDAQLTAAITHDPLTGLANRFKFEEILRGLLDLYRAKTNVLISRKRAAPCAVLYIGLDHFSHINKGLGHDTGDKLLQGVAHRIKSCISDLDLAARLGGDEFTVALTHMFDATNAIATAQDILKSLDAPFLIDGNEIFSSASIGIATYPECGDSTGELLTNSHIAMQTAKANGRHGIQFFTESLNQNYLTKIEREGEFRDALARDQLNIAFIAFMSPSADRILGHYLSLLWQDPQRGYVDATDIIAGMGNSQVLTKLVQNMLHDGISQYQSLCNESLPDTKRLVIPFPAFALITPAFIATLRRTLAETGFSPQQLAIEINETRTDINLLEYRRVTNQIKELGIAVGLNLFSSPKMPLTHLYQLNLDMVRIDLAAQELISEDLRSHAFLKSLADMAHALGMQVVIDNVTSDGQLAMLQEISADAVMGSLFGAAIAGPSGD